MFEFVLVLVCCLLGGYLLFGMDYNLYIMVWWVISWLIIVCFVCLWLFRYVFVFGLAFCVCLLCLVVFGCLLLLGICLWIRWLVNDCLIWL